jgi:hypothetical protein
MNNSHPKPNRTPDRLPSDNAWFPNRGNRSMAPRPMIQMNASLPPFYYVKWAEPVPAR